MQKFTNTKTGHTVRVKNAETAKLMVKSSRYTEVAATSKKSSKKTDADATATE